MKLPPKTLLIIPLTAQISRFFFGLCIAISLAFFTPPHLESASPKVQSSEIYKEIKPPKLTIILVIDQFSAHYIEKLKPYLTGGLKLLISEGINYTNAFYDHAPPGTAPGHLLLSTGTYACYHGIVNNRWFDKNGNEIEMDDDSSPKAAVFRPDNQNQSKKTKETRQIQSCENYGPLVPKGKSAHHIMVDTLSDQLMLHSYPHARNNVWALSLKSRTAISLAGRLGKAVWFDEISGMYTSSKAYFSQLPDWIRDFNKKYSLLSLNRLHWNLCYPKNAAAYSFDKSTDYSAASLPETSIGKTFNLTLRNKKRSLAELYERTPLCNEHFIHCAIACINAQYNPHTNERLIIWLGLSCLDKIAHIYGPDSSEAIDMIYHMDKHIGTLIESVYQKVDKKNVLIVLTADHGVQPITQILQKKKFDLARRYDIQAIIKQCNAFIANKYGVSDFIQNFNEPQFYIDQNKSKKLSKKTVSSIYGDIKKMLLKIPGFRNVWTYEELEKTRFHKYDLDSYLQKQLFKGRSGQIFYSAFPYTMIDKHTKGTSHVSPYAYDTHVPLIFYQPGRFERKTIAKNVYIKQVPVTLASILKVPRPSAATASLLPGL